MQKLRKTIAFSVMLMTVLSMSLVATVNVQAATSGDLVKVDGASAVYYLGADSRLYVFPNQDVFFSWYSDFNSVVTISATELNSYGAPKANVVMRAGTRLIKRPIPTAPEVYAVEPNGTLRWIDSEATAIALYGNAWATRVVDVVDSFFTNYQGDNAKTNKVTAAAYPAGSLIKAPGAGDIYYIDTDGKARLINDEAAFDANRFKWSDVVTAAAGFTMPAMGATITGALFNDTSQGGGAGTGITPGAGTGLTASLSSMTQPASTLVEEQSLANLASFNLTASNDGTVKVTTLKVKRIGVSADTTLSNVYLYEGSNRLTDNATVSSGYITFVNSAGIITIPAGTTKTITVKSSIADATSGQTVGVAINAASDITTDGASVTGSFPQNGNLMSIASATLAGVAMNATTFPATGTIDAGETAYSVWKNSVSINNRAVSLEYLKVREIGSILAGDLVDFNLYVDGVQVGTTQQMDSNYYVTFDLSGAPVTLNTGTRTLEIKANVINGSSKNFSMSLRYAVDMLVKDSEYNVYVTPTALPASSGTIGINAGTLSFEKSNDSPSSTVVKGASNVSLAKYTVKAYGEKIKVETLRVTYTAMASTSADKNLISQLRNAALFANGSQVGSTATLYEDSATPAYTDFNLGSSLVITPGTPVTLEVKADIYDNDGTDSIVSGDKLKATVLSYTNGAQKLTSLGYMNVPSNSTAANTVTVTVGALSTSKNTSYADQSAVDGVAAYKLGSFVVSAASGEDVNLNTFTVGITYTDTASTSGETDTAANTLSDLYLVYGDKTTTPKATVSTSNDFSISKTMTNNSQMVVDVYASINTSPEALDTIRTSLAVTANTAASGANADVDAVNGQLITFRDGTVTASVDGTTPTTDIIMANSQNTVAKYKFTTQYAPVTLKDVVIKLATAASSRSVAGAKLDLNNDGTADTPLVNFVLSGGEYYASFTSVNYALPASANRTIAVMLTTNDVVANGVSGDDVKVSLFSYKYNLSGTDYDSATALGLDGNSMIVKNTRPTIVKLSSSGTLNGSEMDVYKFKVGANANADVAVKQMKFTVSIVDNTLTANTLQLGTFKLYKGTTNITDNVSITNATTTAALTNLKTGVLDEGSSQTVVVRFTTEDVIGANQDVTYTLKATPVGFSAPSDDDYFTIQMAGDDAAATNHYLFDNNSVASNIIVALGTSGEVFGENANFIWSDNAPITKSLIHSYDVDDEDDSDTTVASSDDWTNGYLVDELPASAVQWTY
jgi:hypothetical protein